MLPHFKNIEAAKYYSEPIFQNLYEIELVKEEKNVRFISFSNITDEIFAYNLEKSKIQFSLNFNENTSIKDLCAYFNDVKEVKIIIHDKKGEVIKTITLEMLENCLDNFSFKQNWALISDLVHLDITLNYKEITSETTRD